MSHDAPLPGYTIRRPLPPSALLPAVGAGVAIGLAAFYLTKLLLERQPLLTPEERERRARALERRTGRRVSTLGGEMVGGAEDLRADEEAEELLPERYEKRIAKRVKRLVQRRIEEEREAEEARAAERAAKKEARVQAEREAQQERGEVARDGLERGDTWDREQA
jgi:hypothetical protein